MSLPLQPREGIRSVVIKTIPHNQQRYDTIGDWLVDGTTLTIYTSELGDWRMSTACALHEMAEALLCVQDGVKEETVSEFDKMYEVRRKLFMEGAERGPTKYELAMGANLSREFKCLCEPTEDSEPGEDRHAPYRIQHAFADGIERLFANEIGVVWDEYAEKVSDLEYEPEGEDAAS